MARVNTTEDPLFEQILATQRTGQAIGAMRVKIQVQEWLIRHAEDIPPDAFLALREIVSNEDR